MSHWIEKTNIYHIYPLGFCGCEKFRSEAKELDEGRILKVLDWIPHLKKLKMNAVYFGPVFESFEHGYDTILSTSGSVQTPISKGFATNCTKTAYALFWTAFSTTWAETTPHSRICSRTVKARAARTGSQA